MGSCLALLLVLGGGALAVAPPGLVAQSPLEVVAWGLDNPRGLDFGPEGALYIAEAGVGGNGSCIPGPLGPMCYGATGAVTRLHKGQQERVIEGLPSLSGQNSGGFFSFGPHDIAVRRGQALIAIGLDATIADRDLLGAEGREFAHLVRVRRNDKMTSLADLAAYEQANNSDGAMASGNEPELRSNPHNVLFHPGGALVIDSGANALLAVRRDGRVSTLATFPAREMMLPGTDQIVDMQSVPTAAARGPNGVLYVGELTGFPFPEGESRVYRVVPGQQPEVYLEGFTHIIDLAVDKEGVIYILQIANTSLLDMFASGQLAVGSVIAVSPGGERKVLLDEGLVTPTGLAIGPDGYLYISNCGVCAGQGEIVRLPIDGKAVEDEEAESRDKADDGDDGEENDEGDERDDQNGRGRGRQRD